jgi:hypothetical protein
MSYFLVIFDRRRQGEAAVERLEDPDLAVERLFELEKQLAEPGAKRGVVLLVADDEGEIRRTHSHYFKSFDELLERASSPG